MTKSVFIFSLCLFSPLLSLGQTKDATTKLQNHKALSNATVGICIQNMKGEDIININKKKSLTPASILKIITTASALEMLGDTYRYKTQLAIDKDELFVIGSGDPTLGSEHFKDPKAFLSEWSDKIMAQKPTTPIHIHILDHSFGYQGTSHKWIREDMGNYYAAGAYGISVFDNSYRLTFNTMNGSPQIIGTSPAMPMLAFTNTLQLNTTGKDNGYIWGEPFSNSRLLVGDIPANKSAFTIKGDIPDPGLFLGSTLADLLRSQNMPVGKVQTAREDFYSKKAVLNEPQFQGQVFYTHLSPSLKEIVRIVNVKSNNHYAEHLVRTIARQGKPDMYSDPLKEGIDAIRQHWNKKGINTSGLFMYDACGLTPSDAVNPELMCDILRYMYTTSDSSDAFLASLPQAGTNGTVTNFLKGSRLAGKVFVKSGSIADVQSYAGYYIDGNKKYVFTIIVNHFDPNSRADVVKAIENFLLAVF